MAYQPVVWARSGQRFGHEALLRTSAADASDATAFLDIARRLDRASELGRAVRGRVAGDLPAMEAAVLVNLHPHEFTDRELGSPTDPLSGHAHRIVLEVTERASLEDISGLRETVARLRERGFRIAVDDLGSGYAALSSFAALEPELVKLDMSLIRGIESHSTKRKLVGSVSQLCHDLGILVVAEGIETPSEREALTDLGCDLLQGYLLGRPEPRTRI
jgi:EAL domain-containing protein (putative c-di-GMP-specific phosphodiesterase class I)